MSETGASHLAWSVYADGGRGCLIEFDSRHPWFDARKSNDDSFRHLRPVKYVAARKPNSILGITDDEVLYTKTNEWSFEKEWRIIRNFNDAQEIVGKDVYGADVLLFDIPPSAIRSVILGYRTAPPLENELREIVAANPGLLHIIFRGAVLEANGHIRIEIRPATISLPSPTNGDGK